MQDHRIGCDDLLALQAVDQEARHRVHIELRKLAGDRPDARDRARVVVVVVADEQFLGQALDRFWIEWQRLRRKTGRLRVRMRRDCGRGDRGERRDE